MKALQLGGRRNEMIFTTNVPPLREGRATIRLEIKDASDVRRDDLVEYRIEKVR